MQPGSISARAAACDHAIDREINCSTFECRNESEIVEKVNSLISDPDMAWEIEREVRSDVLSEFNKKALEKRICEFVREIFSTKGRLKN